LIPLWQEGYPQTVLREAKINLVQGPYAFDGQLTPLPFPGISNTTVFPIGPLLNAFFAPAVPSLVAVLPPSVSRRRRFQNHFLHMQGEILSFYRFFFYCANLFHSFREHSLSTVLCLHLFFDRFSIFPTLFPPVTTFARFKPLHRPSQTPARHLPKSGAPVPPLFCWQPVFT